MTWYESLFWLVVIYLLPAIVAWRRHSAWRSLCYFCTVFFGWTVIGWFVAWFLAFHRRDQYDPHPAHWRPHEDLWM